MGRVLSRQAYFDTGLEVLSESGYGGLKLAEVCSRLGVTTGSFYHYFSSWPVYTGELVEHWLDVRTTQNVELVRAIPDARKRLDAIIEIGVALPHGAESAIRSWSSACPTVHVVQVKADQQRFDVLYTSALEVLGSERGAQLFASWAIYLLIGYEQALLPRDETALAWIADQLLDALDSGRFAGIEHADGPQTAMPPT